MILLTGGVKCGKSSKALEFALRYKKRAFLATGVPFDEEMVRRIERHKEERKDLFDTYEEPVKIYEVIEKIKNNYDVIVIDCMTTWLGNLFYHFENDLERIQQEIEKFLNSLSGKEIIITNEVGLGVIPADRVSRKYVDTLGILNSKLALLSDEVYLMISGIGVKIK